MKERRRIYKLHFSLDVNDCTEEGKTQKRGCETCTCTNKHWHCTNTGCSDERHKRGKQTTSCTLAQCMEE